MRSRCSETNGAEDSVGFRSRFGRRWKGLVTLAEARPTGFEPVTFGFRRPEREFGGARLGSGFDSIPGLEFVWLRLDSVLSVVLLLPSSRSEVHAYTLLLYVENSGRGRRNLAAPVDTGLRLDATCGGDQLVCGLRAPGSPGIGMCGPGGFKYGSHDLPDQRGAGAPS
jgi:hypothetical protein